MDNFLEFNGLDSSGSGLKQRVSVDVKAIRGVIDLGPLNDRVEENSQLKHVEGANAVVLVQGFTEPLFTEENYDMVVRAIRKA